MPEISLVAASPATALPIAWGWRSVLAVVRCLWWLFWLALLGLLLLWAGLYFYLAPHIGQYKGQMEQLASQKLGVTLRIDSVQASTDWLPQLDIRGVRVYDPQGRVALTLPQVQARLTPRSLLRLGADRVVLIAPDLVLRRDRTGRIFVGGIDWGQGESGQSEAAADWFFSLSQFEVRGGTVLWLDEKRQAPALALHELRIGIRNAWGRHAFFVAATPPAAWGQRFTLQANLRSAWPHRHPGAWRTWAGQIYTDMPLANAAQMGPYLDAPVQVLGGAGALRSWADFDQGQIRSLALDVALAQVALRLQPDLPALALQDLQGRLLLLRQPQALSVALKDGELTSADGQHWPVGALQLEVQGSPNAPRAGRLQAESLSLPVLAKMAQSLPMAEHFRQHLLRLAPQGDVRQLQFSWQGDIAAPQHYRAQGQVQGLALAAQPAQAGELESVAVEAHADAKSIAAQASNTPENTKNHLKDTAADAIGQPGLAGADIRFDVNEQGGQASLAMQKGWLEFPGVFAEPRIALDRLSADVSWTLQGEAIRVQVRKAQFANADIQGSAQADWHSSAGLGAARFPGVLDLSGQFERAQAGRVWRYLPLEIPQDARDYVQQAVQGGVGSKGSFQVKGDLLHIPSKDPQQSTFRIAAHIDQGYYQYVPKALLPPGAKPWPALSQLSGELVFDGYGMQVQNARGLLGEVHMEQVQAGLADWDALRVVVAGQLQDDLGVVLNTVRHTGVDELLAGSLNAAQGAGPAQIDLRLDLPIEHIEQSKASGQLRLLDNHLRLRPELPSLQALHGSVRFDENSFVLQDLKAQALGGALQLQGGMGALAGRKDAGVHIQAQGQVGSPALRAQTELPWLAQLGPHLQGSTAYSLQVDAVGEALDVVFSSPMQGMAVDLPAPLGKSAASVQALRLSQRSLPSTPAGGSLQQWQASWGQALAAQYEVQRDQGGSAVVRGQLSLGTLPAQARLPDSGVQLLLQADELDALAWYARLSAALDAGSKMASEQVGLQAYLPQRVALRVGRLLLGDRVFHAVNAVVERGSDSSSGSDKGKGAGPSWKVSGQSQELSGQLEYRVGSTGQSDALSARLQRLNWTEAQATQMNNNLLHAPSSIPALDVVVDDFSLYGKSLGRLEINANNYGDAKDSNREWRLNKLGISSPEAQFSGTGAWLAGQGRTVLNFKWALQDAGKLLDRLGQKEVLAKGKGSIEGQISWQGAITTPDYPSMNGKLQLQVNDGRFLKADPGAAKLLGVLNLQALPRRLNLDFRDVFAQGFAFDFVRGDVVIQKGLASTNNLQIKGVNAAVLMEGVADIKDETQDLRVVVVPEINAGTAALVATAINPAVGLGAFVAQWLLSKPVSKAATQELRITGSWTEPKVEKIDAKNSGAASLRK